MDGHREGRGHPPAVAVHCWAGLGLTAPGDADRRAVGLWLMRREGFAAREATGCGSGSPGRPGPPGSVIGEQQQDLCAVGAARGVAAMADL